MKLTPVQINAEQWGLFAPEEAMFVLHGTQQDVQRALLQARRSPQEVRRAFEQTSPNDLSNTVELMRLKLPERLWWRHLSALQALGAPLTASGAVHTPAADWAAAAPGVTRPSA